MLKREKSIYVSVIFAFLIILFSYLYIFYEKKKTKKIEYDVLDNGIFKLKFQDKELRFLNQEIFMSATNFWRTKINNKHKITIKIFKKDVNSNNIAIASIVSSNENNLTTDAEILLNSRAWNSTLSASRKELIIKHELAHAFGIGLKWVIATDETNGPYLPAEMYPETMNAYVTMTGVDNNLGIPVEKSGGRGVATIHWENNDRLFDNVIAKGIPNDLMSCSLDNKTTLSLLTLNNLKDLGWDVSLEEYGNIDFTLPRMFQSGDIVE